MRKAIPVYSLNDNGPWPADVKDRGDGAMSMVGRVADGWLYLMSFAIQNGRWVVRELNIFPEPLNWRPTLNRHKNPSKWVDPTTPIPAGGLTARVLRRVPFGSRSAVAILGGFADAAKRIAAKYLHADREGKAQLLKVAECYVAAVRSGSHSPNAVVARKLNKTVQEVTNLVHRCRVAKMLSAAPKQGAPGGTLTLKALDLIAKHADRSRAFTALTKGPKARLTRSSKAKSAASKRRG